MEGRTPWWLPVLMAFVLLPFSVVHADGGPHGVPSPSMNDCLLCHRAHVARGFSSATPTVELCFACHGSPTMGAHTDVVDGVYEGLGNPQGLRGGGFFYALMDTDWSGRPRLRATTSSHLWSGETGMAWGQGTSGPGEPMRLSCLNCHNPHGHSGPNGEPTYRVLRPEPLGAGTEPVVVMEERSKRYTVDAQDAKYFGQWYPPALYQQLGYWCAQCHDRYLQTADEHHGAPPFVYQHISVGWPRVAARQGNTEYMNRPFSCLTCHVAHGTAAHMAGWAAQVPWPDGSQEPRGDARSSLLRTDNRGVCQLCHEK